MAQVSSQYSSQLLSHLLYPVACSLDSLSLCKCGSYFQLFYKTYHPVHQENILPYFRATTFLSLSSSCSTTRTSIYFLPWAICSNSQLSLAIIDFNRGFWPQGTQILQYNLPSSLHYNLYRFFYWLYVRLEIFCWRLGVTLWNQSMIKTHFSNWDDQR